MGIGAEEFFALTPRQLSALSRRSGRRAAEREFLFAQLASCVVNFSMAAPKEPARPVDFMPSEWRRKATRPKVKRRSRRAVADQVRSVMADFMR